MAASPSALPARSGTHGCSEGAHSGALIPLGCTQGRGGGGGLDDRLTFANYLSDGFVPSAVWVGKQRKRQGSPRVPSPGRLPVGLLKVTALKMLLATFPLTSSPRLLPQGLPASGLQLLCDFSVLCSPAPSLRERSLQDLLFERS